MRLVAAVCLALMGVQDSGPDRLTTSSGEEIRGEIVRIEADGGLAVKTSTGQRVIPLDNLRRISFEEKPLVAIEKTGERMWPRLGGALTGTVVSIDADRVTLKCSHGTYAVRKDEVRGIAFGGTRVSLKESAEIKEDQDLVVLGPGDGKAGDPIAVSGKFETLDGEKARVDGTEYARNRVLEIRFRTAPAREPAVGLFARVQLKNGDGLVGSLRKVEATRVHLFTHYAGVATIGKSEIHSIALVPLARLQSGHILVCEPAGVSEIDRQGVKIWMYPEAAGANSARKLPNGNVLIAQANMGRVFEVRPTGKAGGQVVWTIDGLLYPCDAQKLDNGNILIAEFSGGRVAEIDPKDGSRKWAAAVSNPTSAERLEDGSTLVSMNQGAPIELDARGAVRHRYVIQQGSNEYRSTRTAEGTTLIADQRGMLVLEMDRRNAILWKYDQAPQPRMAIRLDDGHTMIFKRNGEIVEVDSRGQTMRTFGKFSGAGAFSVY
ncbi:MAG TPA: PQQ-binding-like beta-propeller repeat protein [Planctomycetota bacterium]|nr:PQQ-binding-like beta-propeller repeat protein [Planctomycetota bacterium]